MGAIPDTEVDEGCIRRHNRRLFKLIPELRGMPYDVQERLYVEALKATREFRGGCLSHSAVPC